MKIKGLTLVKNKNMNALEASQKSHQCSSVKLDDEYECVMRQITHDVGRGEHCTYISGISQEVKERLKNEGYSVKKIFFGEYRVSW